LKTTHLNPAQAVSNRGDKQFQQWKMIKLSRLTLPMSLRQVLMAGISNSVVLRVG